MIEYDHKCVNCGVEVFGLLTASELHGGAFLCVECYYFYEDYAYEDYRDPTEMYRWVDDWV